MVRHKKLESMLADLPMRSPEDLKAEWQQLYGTAPPPRLSRDLLVRAVAYRLQEQVHGGLSPAIRKHLQQHMTGNRDGSSVIPLKIKPGTRLVRVWQGVSHHVQVTDTGFVWQDRTYASLSAIARAITDTRWNGRAFFGLHTRRQVKAAQTQQDGNPEGCDAVA